MSRRIYGITVGTPMKPQALVDKTKQADQIKKNTKALENKLDKSNHQPNMYLGTDDEGNVVYREGGSNYNVDNETLVVGEDGKLRVNTADKAEADNTRPITSAAVHTQIGNIEALLDTI